MMVSIVIVEDDPDLVRLLSIRLRKAGYDITAETDGVAGLDAIRREIPDAVIVDWMMPGLTGIEVCQRMRKDPVLEKLPVLMLTAKSSLQDAEQAVGAGIDAFLSKPCSTSELIDRVEAVMAAKSRLRTFRD